MCASGGGEGLLLYCSGWIYDAMFWQQYYETA